MTEGPEYPAYWATEGLFVIADAIKAKRGDENSLVMNEGGSDFVCSTFIMRSHREPPDDVTAVIPANFSFHPASFEIRWERLAGIHQVANRPKPPGMMWELAVAECIKAVADFSP